MIFYLDNKNLWNSFRKSSWSFLSLGQVQSSEPAFWLRYPYSTITTLGTLGKGEV